MIKIVLLGGGNLAFHLTNEFIHNSEIELVQVYNRSLEKIEYLKNKTSITNQFSALKEADVYIVCVSDDAIPEVSEQINFPNKLIVHTSGAMDLKALKSNTHIGVFYPLQSFSKDKKVDFSNIPICIEVENEQDLSLLFTLGMSLSDNCYNMNSDQRKHLHVAAVFVNNFVNHMYFIGNEICTENNIPFEILKPLIEETASKIKNLAPLEAQTGPAKRQDSKTLETHLDLITEDQQKIYKLLTQSIIDTHGKKL